MIKQEICKQTNEKVLGRKIPTKITAAPMQWPFFFLDTQTKEYLWNSADAQRCKILRSLLLFAGRWMARDDVVVLVVVVGEWVATHVVHQRRQQRGVYQLLIGRE